MRLAVPVKGARVWGAPAEPGGQWVVPLGGVLGLAGLCGNTGLLGLFGVIGLFGLGAVVFGVVG
jgi:hypothetical protein